MTHQYGWRGVYILFAALFLLLPIQTNAQASIAIDKLSVALWPEYDRPEVLVVYKVELSPDVSLPAQLTFRLPGYVDQMHAVAMGTDDGLINVGDDLIKTSYEGDDFILSFPTSSSSVQFEYYDPAILSRQNQNRELNFNFSAPYNTGIANVEVQHPFGAESFSLTPEPDSIITGGDSLKYSTIVAGSLAAGEGVQISASYRRSTNDLSLQALQQGGAAQNAAQNLNVPAASPAAASTSALSPNIAYGLIGLGAVLLVGAGGYWWYTTNRSRKESAPQRRAPQKGRKPARRKREKSNKQQQATLFATEPAVTTGAAFCYKCGAALKNDANFCHTCGAKRRG